MFGGLASKFKSLFERFEGEKTLTQESIVEAVREVRVALLDADVNFKIVSAFIKCVKEKAIGTERVKGVSFGDQFVKIVHAELVSLMGEEVPTLNLNKSCPVILLVGLQGSGKTTQAAKLANYLKEKKECKSPLLVALDLQRPSAIEQLQVLGQKINVPVYAESTQKNPLSVLKGAIAFQKTHGHDLMILDTAGRLHIDDQLMKELADIRKLANPDEVLFVANSATGQEAVTVAKEFNEKISITGSILTMLDGSSRSGAAISIMKVSGKPLKFEGIGERIEDIQPFNSHSMADRILGMGDVINLVRRAEEQFDQKEQAILEKKMRKAEFTFDDYLAQMKKLRKMGPLKSLMKMVPGFSEGGDFSEQEKNLANTESIILSMTIKERLCMCELIPTRRMRIAKGSGNDIQEVNKLVKNFKQIKKMMKGMPAMRKKFEKSGKMPVSTDQLRGKF